MYIIINYKFIKIIILNFFILYFIHFQIKNLFQESRIKMGLEVGNKEPRVTTWA